MVPDNENGYFVGPTLFDRVKPGMRIYDEEILAQCFLLCVSIAMKRPSSLLTIMSMVTVRRSSRVIWDTARQFTETVQVGMIGVNVPTRTHGVP